MGIFSKIKQINQKVRIAGAVAKIVLGGTDNKVLKKIEHGAEIAEKAIEISEMVKGIIGKK